VLLGAQSKMLVRGLIRRLHRKPLPALVIIFSLLFFMIYFSVSSYNVPTYLQWPQNIKFQNPLSKELLPVEAFAKSFNNGKLASDRIYNSLYNKLSSPEIVNSNWKLIDHFFNHKIDSNDLYIDSYFDTRLNQHLYDPRITLSVYLDFLNDQYDINSNEIPFAWDDWADLSYLNKFLNKGLMSCAEFFENFDITLAYGMDKSLPSSDYFNQTFCLDNSEFLSTENGKYKDEKLLPGFNFKQRIDEKSTFVGKIYNAKSYLLSFAEPPTFIYFLNDNGTYHKTKTYSSSSMMRNGMIKKYLSKNSFNGFNPINELSKLNKDFLIHNKNDFSEKLMKTKSNNFKIDIPQEKFIFDPYLQYKELYEKDFDSLQYNEQQFIKSLNYSIDVDPNDIDKHFKEVNIKWPAKYNNHQLIEDGGHYDFRFFSGFFSEMPISEFTFRSPRYNFTSNKFISSSADNSINRRSIILSHLLHIILTTAFHDGLFMFPAHGSLLSWYFTSSSFPWDSDGDVQMPISDLAEFCLRYNNSMIVENPKFGTAKAFVDCSSTLTHRGKENGSNNIDARVIDVDSGLFVDITGLSVSGDALSLVEMNTLHSWLPHTIKKSYPFKKIRNNKNRVIVRSKKIKVTKETKPDPIFIDKATEEKVLKIHKENKIYNCRNDHYYTHDQLSPLRLTLFEGAPTFVPAQKRALREVLEIEYSKKSLQTPAWDNYIYSTSLRMWINADDIYQVFLSHNIGLDSRINPEILKKRKNVQGAFIYMLYLQNESLVISDMLKNAAYDITSDDLLITNNKRRPKLNIIEELFHDKIYASAHSKEMAVFDSGWEWKTSRIDDKVDLSNDWRQLAHWMLLDHAPPKMPLLDYLIFTEQVDAGYEPIHFSRSENFEMDLK
jgi:hypothetical protein